MRNVLTTLFPTPYSGPKQLHVFGNNLKNLTKASCLQNIFVKIEENITGKFGPSFFFPVEGLGAMLTQKKFFTSAQESCGRAFIVITSCGKHLN